MSAERIAEVVSLAPRRVAPDSLSGLAGGVCQGSKFHSPAPLLVRSLALGDAVGLLVFEQDPGTDVEPVHLCATCRDNLTVYLSVLAAYDGATPHSVRRDFGNLTRALGDRAWALHQARAATPV
jgi:hypothetical protein